MQLENEHSLFDYNVGLNAIIQVIFRAEETVEKSTKVMKETEKVEKKEVDRDDEVRSKGNNCAS